jgi:hypothetical protein
LLFNNKTSLAQDTIVSPADSTIIQNLTPANDTSSAITDTSAIDGAKIHIHNPSGAMWRSMLLPGWGQLYNGKYLKALIIGGGEIGLIWGIYAQHQRLQDARKANDEIAENFYRDDRNRLTWWLVGTILYSMADAYVDGQLWNYDLSDEISLVMSAEGIAIKW